MDKPDCRLNAGRYNWREGGGVWEGAGGGSCEVSAFGMMEMMEGRMVKVEEASEGWGGGSWGSF